MAKALFGHVGSAPDRRLVDEVTQLRAKVRALEFEVVRLRAENDRLAAAASETVFSVSATSFSAWSFSPRAVPLMVVLSRQSTSHGLSGNATVGAISLRVP